MATIDLFKRKIEQVEQHGLLVLDHCIDALRSAEQGLELINNMTSIDTRPSFRDHVMKKHESVTKKFLTEISFVEQVFMRQKSALTLQRFEPVHSGAIHWERLLFHQLKKSVLAFRKVEACFENNYLKDAAFSQYFKLVSDMQSFEKQKFDSFEGEAIYDINSVVKGNILSLAFNNDNQCKIICSRENFGLIIVATVATAAVEDVLFVTCHNKELMSVFHFTSMLLRTFFS